MQAIRSLLLFALLSLLAGCATGPATVAEIDDGVAERLMAEGDFRGAAAEYQRLAKSNRRNRESLLLRAADALREEDDFDAIVQLSGEIKRKRLSVAEGLRLDLLLAEAALAVGDAEAALTLATLPEDQLDPELRPRLYEIRARALLKQGKTLDAARVRMALNALLPRAERGANESELLDMLAAADVVQLQRELGGLAGADPLRPWIERALRLKGSAPARLMVRPTRQVGTLLPGSGADEAWKREGYSATPRVALLLPLSGTLASAGQAVRDGFFAAYFAETGERPQVRLFDSGDTVDAALVAYQQAAEDGSARIVGPLMREQVQALFEQDELRTPVLALNHPDSGAPPPAGSHLFGLLPDEEGAVAAEHALERGFRRAAILAGMEEWGERAALAFRAQFEHGGGIIVGEARLAADAVDFGTAIAQATGSGVETLFLAVRPSHGRLVVPQLRARGMDQTPIFATSHIYAGSPSRGLDRDLDGVEFCDAPWLFGLTPGVPARETLQRNLAAAGAAPRLFAFGMDAYRLLPYLDWLSQNHDAYLPGSSGQLAVDDFGRIRRVPTWMRFQDGMARAADGVLLPETASAPAPATPQ